MFGKNKKKPSSFEEGIAQWLKHIGADADAIDRRSEYGTDRTRI